jgi:hypothetical protein
MEHPDRTGGRDPSERGGVLLQSQGGEQHVSPLPLSLKPTYGTYTNPYEQSLAMGLDTQFLELLPYVGCVLCSILYESFGAKTLTTT